jgi:hypothetical protein
MENFRGAAERLHLSQRVLARKASVPRLDSRPPEPSSTPLHFVLLIFASFRNW